MIRRIFDYLEDCGQPVYLVGGSLRQWLLGKPIKDYDFILPAGSIRLAYRLADHFRLDCFPLDRERDMARVVMQEWTLDFAPFGADLNLDLKSRDLSINAMACPVSADLLSADVDSLETRLIDPVGGLNDLRKGLVRGLAEANFSADPLRMLRAYRFAASLNFTLDPMTEAWIIKHATELQQVAKERIIQELVPILLQPQSAPWIETLQQKGLLTDILPSPLALEQLQVFESMGADDRLDIFKPYLEMSITAQRPRAFVFKLGLLLLRPGHVSNLASLQRTLSPLTLSRREFDVVMLWDRLIPPLLKLFEQDTPSQRFHLFRLAGEDILGLLILADVWRYSGQIAVSQSLLIELSEQWLDPENQMAHPRQLLDGHTLIHELGLRPGPEIGQQLLAVQEAQACGQVGNKLEALAYLRSLGANHSQ